MIKYRFDIPRFEFTRPIASERLIEADIDRRNRRDSAKKFKVSCCLDTPHPFLYDVACGDWSEQPARIVLECFERQEAGKFRLHELNDWKIVGQETVIVACRPSPFSVLQPRNLK